MDMIPVSSRNIASIGYDEATAVLEIDFLSGHAYEYYDVPQYIFDELMAANSKGSYAHHNVYKAFSQQRIR